MGLSSIFQRKPSRPAVAAPDVPADVVQQARIKARRRLIGAVVLVVIGVIGFPILFETQPRPLPVDIPIEIPRKEQASPLAMPAARPARPDAGEPQRVRTDEPGRTPASSAQEGAGPRVATAPARSDEARIPEAASRPSAPKEAASREAAAREAAARESAKEAAAREAAAREAATRAAAAKEAAAKEAADGDGRYVVQVGAFTDSAAARETRRKVERLGLKTYTQVTETPQGSRIRVRVGPFASREEADRVLARLKAAGSPAVVLTL